MDILERVEVETMRASTRDKEAFQKLSVLILLDMGKKYEEIAQTLGIGLGTIGNCKHKYQSDGLYSYLDKHHVPYLGKLTDEQLARLDEEVSNIGEVVLYIHRTFGIAYCERAVCAILHKLDFVCKKTNNVPCKADPVEQKAFLGEMVPFLAEIEPDEAAYFLDGVHPQHNTRATYAWIKRGEPKKHPGQLRSPAR